MKKGTVLLRETAHGRVMMTTSAIAAVAGRAVEESFGVVDHGINLAEVTAMVQSRVTYEVERHTGLDVKAVDVHVDSARRAE